MADNVQVKSMKFSLEHYPLLPFCLAYIAGIAVADLLDGPDCPLCLLVAIIVSVALPLLIRKPFIQQFLIVPPFFFVGMVAWQLKVRAEKVDYPMGFGTYETVVIGEPVEKENSLVMDLEILSGKYKSRKARAYFSKHSSMGNDPLEIGVGDGLVVNCKLQKPENFRWDQGGNFNYERYMMAKGIPFVTYISKGKWSKKSLSLEGISVLDRARIEAARIRHSLVEKMGNLGMEDDRLAIAAAMSLGDRSKIRTETKIVYSISGASHILALSGTHLSVIYMLIAAWGGRHRLRIWKELSVLMIIWIYVFLVGMPPSAVRSAIMITMMSLAYLTYRDRHLINSIVVAALISSIANPFAIFDISTQMSFASITSIALLREPLNGILYEKFGQNGGILGKLWTLTCLSVSAQIGTAPLVAYYFGQLPTFGVLTNFVAIPGTTLILYLSVAILIIPVWLFLGPIVSILVKVLDKIILYLNGFLDFAASLSYSSITVEIRSSLQLLLIYFITLIIIIFLRTKLWPRGAAPKAT